MKRNTTGLHVRTKLQRARETAGYRKLAGGGPVLPSSYPRDALGYSPTDFQPAGLLPSVAPGATQPPDPSSSLAALAVLKAVTPVAKQVLGLTGGGSSGAPGLGNLLAGGIGKGGEVTDGLLGSGGQLFGTVNPETGLPIGGVSVGQIGTGLGGLGGIAGGIMGLTNAGNQNGVGIAGDVAQLGGGAAALGSSLGLLGAAGGPIGLAVAGVGALASSLFGNKKPHNISGLVINSVGSDGTLAPLAVGNDNHANTDQLQDLLGKVAQPYLQQLGKHYGVDLSGVNIGAFAHQTEGKGDSTIGFTGPVPGQSWAIDPNDPASVDAGLAQLGQALLASKGITPSAASPDRPAPGGSAAPPPRPEPALVTADDIRRLYGRADGGLVGMPPMQRVDLSVPGTLDLLRLLSRAGGGERADASNRAGAASGGADAGRSATDPNRPGTPGAPASGPGSYATPGSIGSVTPGGMLSTGLGIAGAPTGIGSIASTIGNTIADQIGFANVAANNGLSFSAPSIGALANNLGYHAVQALTLGLLDPASLGLNSPAYENAVDQARNVAMHDLAARTNAPPENPNAEQDQEKSLQEGFAANDASHPSVATESLGDNAETETDDGDRESGRDGFGSHGDTDTHESSDHDSHDGDDGDARGGRIGDKTEFSGLLKGPGTPTSDSIPTRLTGGGKGPMVSRDEFVVNARTVRKLGPHFLYGLQQLAAERSRITPDDIRALYQETKMGFPTEGMARYRGINRTRLPAGTRTAASTAPAMPLSSRAPMVAVMPNRTGPAIAPQPQIGRPMITAEDLRALYAAAAKARSTPSPAPALHLARGGMAGYGYRNGGYIHDHLDAGGTVGAAPIQIYEPGAAIQPGEPGYSGGYGSSGFSGSASTSGMQAIGSDTLGNPGAQPNVGQIVSNGYTGPGSMSQQTPTAGNPGGFDAAYYLANNPDVAAAAQKAGGDQSAFALNHWLQYGRTEDRPVNAQEAAAVQTFDPTGYLTSNSDVLGAVNKGQFGGGNNAALQHFIDYGFFEGRSPTGYQGVGTPGFTPSAGTGVNGVKPGGAPATQPPAPGLTADDVISIFHQLFPNGALSQTVPGVASSFVDPSSGATVTQQGPAQNAIQVLNALSPARGNRFASEYAAPTFWG